MSLASIRAWLMILLGAATPIFAFGGVSLAASPSDSTPAMAPGDKAPTCAGGVPAIPAEAYALIPEGDRGWTGTNPIHRLDLEISAAGLSLRPSGESRPAWERTFSLARIGPPGDTDSAGGAWPTADGNRVDLLRGRLREWFVNSAKGIEHGVEIPEGTPGGEIWLEYASLGGPDPHAATLVPKPAEDARALSWNDASGSPVLRHRDLQAIDADQREVPVRWERIEGADASADGARLVVEGSDHRFPVRVMERLVTPKGLARPAPPAPRGDSIPAGVLAAPGNDQCSGAEAIPGGGPFPYLGTVTDLTDATSTGDPPLPTCQTNVSRSVWYRFVPDSSALYTFSLCEDAPTGTTLPDTVLAAYAAAGDCTLLQPVAGGCDDDGCAGQDLQSVLTDLDLTAGTLYYIVAWQYGVAPPDPGAAQIQLRVSRRNPPGPAPPNDTCGGAEVIPGGGPFPYLTAITADIGGATGGGDPPAPTCQPNVSRSIWYAFTPSTGGRYTFSVCSDAPTGTTVDDTVLGLYSAGGACAGLMPIGGGCDDDSCAVGAAQSVINGASLVAGTTYYLVAWQYGTIPPIAGHTAVQVRVSRMVGPPNDHCAGATLLELSRPLTGTTASAADDSNLPSGTTCFTGIGQTPSTAIGRDVVYRFTAPTAGRYSFRVTGFDSARNAVLYVATDCPTGNPPALVTGCLAASNRNAGAPGEEVRCRALGGGESVYVYVDEHTVTAGGGFTVEVDPCAEESEPNDLPSSAGELACGLEGAIAPAGDVDYFALGAPAGSRVFALADGVSGNSTDFDLRVTSAADTLEYDDLNNDLPFGSASPNLAGTALPGPAAYLRVNHFSAATLAEPYRLYAAVQPPSAQASAEVEPNDTPAAATGAANQYFAGALSSASDVDIFSFTAAEGERIQLGLDLDPPRNGTPFNGGLALLDSTGGTLVQVNDPSSTAATTPGTGNLAASTPYSPSEGIVYRVPITGNYYARVSSPGTGFGDYLLSVAHDCRVLPGTDLSVSQIDAPDPVAPGGPVTYTLTVRNLGSQPAPSVTLRDDLPAESTLSSVVPSQGACSGGGPVTCDLGTVAPAGTATVILVVTAPGVPGTIDNLARVASLVVDPQPANDEATEVTTVGIVDGDGDGVPDASDCAPGDPDLWAAPGEATSLTFPSGGDPASMQWIAPTAPGGTSVLYDLVRSPVPGSFTSAVCVAAGLAATSAGDPAVPTGKFHYLVRARNACGSNLGTRSDGTSRTAPACP